MALQDNPYQEKVKLTLEVNDIVGVFPIQGSENALVVRSYAWVQTIFEFEYVEFRNTAQINT